jgi:hypothetical protein
VHSANTCLLLVKHFFLGPTNKRMAEYIHQLQKSKRKPTEREEEILEELVGTDTKLAKWKVSLIIGIISLLLNVPLLKNLVKKGVPFFANEYYYSLFASIIIFVVSFIVIQV